MGKETILVTCGIIEKDGKILIAKRKDKEGDKWEFPGGKVERGEDLKDCLKREIKEELNLDITVLDCISHVNYKTDSGKDIVLYAYRAKYVSGEPTPIEHEEVRWVTKEELADFDFFEPDLKIVEALLTFL
ncbi:MAG: (deoxy)nucleoside triphosphate pyrophosphohydrolase [Desulfobacterota bacterium]|nr:(deoxy)nucleoside triphosphate pyrophosphohydrolase [Thermodesulfobacteriota bacterium]MDW8001614.1 (deoxy)nucleoside triphosphate pyrophosphohydrolase [Deltaproteobacteria bacterium]